MPKTPSQRVRDLEASRRESGLKEIRVWVPANPEAIRQIRELAAKLRAEALPEHR